MTDALVSCKMPDAADAADLVGSRGGHLVLMRREFERIVVGDDFWIEVLDIQGQPWRTDDNPRCARLSFGFWLPKGKYASLQGEYRSPSGVTRHSLSVQLVSTYLAGQRARLALDGTEIVWGAHLSVVRPDVTQLPGVSAVVVSCEKRWRFMLGQDFAIALTDVERRRARLEISAKLFEGECFQFEDVSVTVVAVERNRVRVGMMAPRQTTIDREEVAVRRRLEVQAAEQPPRRIDQASPASTPPADLPLDETEAVTCQ